MNQQWLLGSNWDTVEASVLNFWVLQTGRLEMPHRHDKGSAISAMWGHLYGWGPLPFNIQVKWFKTPSSTGTEFFFLTPPWWIIFLGLENKIGFVSSAWESVCLQPVGRDPHIGIRCKVLSFFLGYHHRTVLSRRFSSSAENKVKVKAYFYLGGKIE